MSEVNENATPVTPSVVTPVEPDRPRNLNQWAKLQTVEQAEQEGRWFTLPNTDAQVLLARAGGSNKRYEVEAARLSAPLQRAAKTGTEINIETLIENNKIAYSKAVVLGFRNVYDPETGFPMEHSPENVLRLFKLVPMVWQQVVEFASNYENYSRHAVGDVTKN